MSRPFVSDDLLLIDRPHTFVRILVISERDPSMKTMSLSEAKSKLSSLVDAVGERDEEVVITRNGRPEAVRIRSDEFDSWKETIAVRSDLELTAEIRKGLEAFARKKARLYTLGKLLDGSGQPPMRRLRVPDDVAGLVRGFHPGIKRKVRAA